MGSSNCNGVCVLCGCVCARKFEDAHVLRSCVAQLALDEEGVGPTALCPPCAPAEPNRLINGRTALDRLHTFAENHPHDRHGTIHEAEYCLRDRGAVTRFEARQQNMQLTRGW